MNTHEITERYLWHLIYEGAHKIYGENIPQEVYDRIHSEMAVIVPNKFDDYILMIWDIYNFCKTPERVRTFCEEKGIKPPPDGIVPLGPGRGSVGGSIVCYCLGIHECDPILFGLYFERFLNPERIAYPDIDWDVSQRYRHIALAYIADKYGEKHVAQIITYGTLSCKTAIHDVLQAANVPGTVINAVKETVPNDPGITFEDLMENDKFIQAMQAIPFPDSKVIVDKSNVMRILNNDTYRCDDNDINQRNMATLMGVMNGTILSGEIAIKSSWTWEKALHVMRRLEGLNKHESTHAAGVVVAPVELETSVPLLRKDGDGVLACQYDMRSLEELGYLKMDALGLRTVDVNHDAEALVRRWYDPEFDVRKIRFDDADAIKLINDGDTVGIFQIESTGFTGMMQQIDIGGYEAPRYADRDESLLSTIEKLRGIEIRDFMWIASGVALYRPGPLDAIVDGKTMVQHLIDRKTGKEPITYLFGEEKNYLEETYGILVYQEQVMARVRQMTGCSLGRADILRKAMGKKDPVLMKEQMDWFESAAMEYNFSADIKNETHKKQIVERAAYEIKTFSRYGFNKAHSVEYAIICYRNAYFKAHYPTAFYTALLNSETGDPKRQAIIIRDMLKHGIQLLPPTINQSSAEFTMTDDGVVRFGIGAIKNIGQRAMETIIGERETNGEYKSVEDFRIRIPATMCNVIAMESLAKCGAFDEFVGGTDDYKFNNRATLVATIRPLCDAIKKISQKKGKNPPPSREEVMRRYDSGLAVYQVIDAEDDLIQYAVWEKEIIKYYISAHPIDAYEAEMRRWTAVEDTELEDLPDEFYIAGFIEEVHETTIKKEGRNKGKLMGFVTIGTAYRTYEATMFPGIYESCVPYLKTGNAVVLKGKRNVYKDNVTIQCAYIRNMINSGIRDCPECHIRLDNPTYAQLIELKKMFDEHPGMTKVFIHTMEDYNDITIECNGFIALNDRIIDYCEQIGEIAYKPI